MQEQVLYHLPFFLINTIHASDNYERHNHTRVNTQIASIPAVRLEVTGLQDPAQVGEKTTHEIRVKNQGSAKKGVNVQVQGELPPYPNLSRPGLKNLQVEQSELSRIETIPSQNKK